MRNGLVTLVLVVGTAALLYLFLFNDTEPESIPYSGSSEAFLDRVERGEVKSVLTRGEALEITLNETDESGQNKVVESWNPGPDHHPGASGYRRGLRRRPQLRAGRDRR